jgi:methylenetetrahydrofolate dehydrogenase (NADP+)/methenyltetrahydrofolate cyclohydrolase
MTARLLEGRRIGDEICRELVGEVRELRSAGWQPRLLSIGIGDNAAIELYVRNQRNRAEQTNIRFDEKRFPLGISVDEMRAAIFRLNVDPSVTGIIVQRPVPETIPIKALHNAIHPLKDVEGMHPASIGNIVYNELELGPCTAVASIELLRRCGVRLQGLEVTVIGHSEIVGKPIAFMLMAEGATVSVCHHMTRDVTSYSKRADAVFVAVGKPRLVTGDMIKPGAILIDIGINRVKEPDGREGIVGDCEFESCAKVAGWITPVPGGVGPVTVAMLMRNTVVAAKRLRALYEAQFKSHIFSPPQIV